MDAGEAVKSLKLLSSGKDDVVISQTHSLGKGKFTHLLTKIFFRKREDSFTLFMYLFIFKVRAAAAMAILVKVHCRELGRWRASSQNRLGTTTIGENAKSHLEA